MSAGAPVLSLVGLRCTGKTSVGRALAERLGRPFVDLDEALVAAERALGAGETQAGELLARLGPRAFREREAAVLAELLSGASTFVLATGGGCVERAESRKRLAAASFCVWLRAPVAVLRDRLAADPTLRPALGAGDPVREVAALAARRAPLYRAVADATVETGDAPVPVVVERVLRALRGRAT